LLLPTEDPPAPHALGPVEDDRDLIQST